MRGDFLHRALGPVTLAVAACGIGAGAAHAQGAGLAAVGPIDPANGFPQYYQDRTGLALEQCFDTTTPGDPCTTVAEGAQPDPTQPIVFPTNFPDEFFYWSAEAKFNLPVNTTPATGTGATGGKGKGGGGGGGGATGGGGGGGGLVKLDMTVEGAFGPGGVAPGQQNVFARFRLRIGGGLVAGANYTVTYPYGVKTFVAAADGTINFTADEGCPEVVGCDFSSVLNTANVGPFLTFDSSNPPAPAGFVGDGATNHAVTGSPLGTNFVRIDGPSVGGDGVNTFVNNLFTVVGKIFDGSIPAPLSVDRTSYSRSAGLNTEVDLFVHSAGTAQVSASGDGLPTTPLTADPVSGRFFTAINLPAGSPLPGFVRYTALAPGDADTVLDSPLIDEVTIVSATYSVGGGVLTVNATSSDQVGLPVLTAFGSSLENLGPLTAGVLVLPLAAPPAVVTVNSAAGGSGTLRVDLVP